MISPELEQQNTWNGPLPEAVERCVHHLVEAQAAEHGDDEAVYSEAGSLTYKQLNDAADRLRDRLMVNGVRSESVVPLCFEHGIPSVVVMLAVLKAGGAIVSVPHEPRERLRVILQQLGNPPLVLASPSRLQAFDGIHNNVWTIGLDDLDEATPASMSGYLQSTNVNPNNVAYIMTTSGSTGVPKAAQVEHRNFCTFLSYFSKLTGMFRRSRTFQFSSHLFDFCLAEIFLPLIVGGAVCIPTEHDRLNDISGAVERMRVTHLLMVPSVLATLNLDELDLESIMMGGEVPPLDVLQQWSRTGRTKVFNIYGPAECANISCMLEVTPSYTPVSGEIGQPRGSAIWLVDPESPETVCHGGKVGEMMIEGPIVGRGYLNNPQQTMAAFVSPPSWLQRLRAHADFKVYLTGDLAKRKANGSLVFLGRKDGQVKIRGQRLELGEVEHQVRKFLPKGSDVAVDIWKPNDNNARATLVALIQIADQSTFETLLQTLRTYLCTTLPTYMIPAYFLYSDSIPRLPSYKVDRRGVKLMIDARSKELTTTTDTEHMLPSTEAQKQMHKMWMQVLRLPFGSIGVGDNFFHLGGDSIAAIRLVAAARRDDCSIDVQTIFANPVLADLARKMSGSTEIQRKDIPPFTMLDANEATSISQAAASQCGVRIETLQDVHPASDFDIGLMMTSEAEEARSLWVSVFIFPITATIDREKYINSWKTLHRHHDIFRTRLIRLVSGTYQVILKADEPHIERSRSLTHHLTEQGTISMGYGQSLSRYAIIDDETTEEAYFVWTAKHVLFDEWSIGLMRDKLTRIYNASVLQPETMKANQLIKYKQELDAAAGEDYFKAHYAGAKFETIFPTNAQRCSADQELRRVVEVSPQRADKITVSTYVSVTWALVLSRFSGCKDISLGTQRTGRSMLVHEIDDYVGPTMLVIPIRVEIEGDKEVRNVLQTFQDVWAETTTYEGLGTSRIRRINDESVAASNTLNFINIHPESRAKDDLLPGCTEVTMYPFFRPVRFECSLRDDGVIFEMWHDVNVVEAGLAAALLGAVEEVYLQLVRGAPEQKVEDVRTEALSEFVRRRP